MPDTFLSNCITSSDEKVSLHILTETATIDCKPYSANTTSSIMEINVPQSIICGDDSARPALT